MSWAGLGNNSFISGNDLQDAVNTSVFTLKSGQSIPANNTWLTKNEINAKVNVNTIGGTGTDWPIKSQLTSSSVWYSYSFVRRVTSSVDYTARMETGMMAHFGSPCNNYTVYSQKVISSDPFGIGDVLYKDSSGTIADSGYYSYKDGSGTAIIIFFNGSTVTETTYADVTEYQQLDRIQLAEWIGDPYYSNVDFPVCYTIGTISAYNQIYAKNVSTGCIEKLNPDYTSSHGVLYPFFTINDGGYGGRGTPFRVNSSGVVLPMITLDFNYFEEYPISEGFEVGVRAYYNVRWTLGTSFGSNFLNDVTTYIWAYSSVMGEEFQVGGYGMTNIEGSLITNISNGTYPYESVMPVELMNPSTMNIYPSQKSGIYIEYYNRYVG